MCKTGQKALGRICGFAVVVLMQGCFNNLDENEIPSTKIPTRSPTGTPTGAPTLHVTTTPEVNSELTLIFSGVDALMNSAETVSDNVATILGVDENSVRVVANYAVSADFLISGFDINKVGNKIAMILQVKPDEVSLDNTRRLANVSAQEHNITVTVTSKSRTKANSIYKTVENGDLGAALSQEVEGSTIRLEETRVEVEIKVQFRKDKSNIPGEKEIENKLHNMNITVASVKVGPPPTPLPTATPSAAPTTERTAMPTHEPTLLPTATPSVDPTKELAAMPTSEPTTLPTSKPSATPTALPTATPTATPTGAPSQEPTKLPTATPTAAPTGGVIGNIGADPVDKDLPLGRCKGDCDDDKHCEGSLICFQRTWRQAMPGCSGEPFKNWDYCVEAIYRG